MAGLELALGLPHPHVYIWNLPVVCQDTPKIVRMRYRSHLKRDMTWIQLGFGLRLGLGHNNHIPNFNML